MPNASPKTVVFESITDLFPVSIHAEAFHSQYMRIYERLKKQLRQINGVAFVLDEEYPLPLDHVVVALSEVGSTLRRERGNGPHDIGVDHFERMAKVVGYLLGVGVSCAFLMSQISKAYTLPWLLTPFSSAFFGSSRLPRLECNKLSGAQVRQFCS